MIQTRMCSVELVQRDRKDRQIGSLLCGEQKAFHEAGTARTKAERLLNSEKFCLAGAWLTFRKVYKVRIRNEMLTADKKGCGISGWGTWTCSDTRKNHTVFKLGRGFPGAA